MKRIRVPATTANFGPGFDSFGLALNLYQSVLIEKRPKGDKGIKWEGVAPLPDNENYVLKALEKTLKECDAVDAGYELTMLPSEIPMQRGLGSSAAAIVSGIMAANYIMEEALTEADMVQLAVAIEGHPDNVVPAIIGGMTITAMENGVPVYGKSNFPAELALMAFIPDCPLSTEKARQVLPEHYSKTHCIHNISRAGMLVHALHSGQYHLLKTALDDVLHQPYRLPLIEDAEKILVVIDRTDAFGSFLSGSGPVIMALIHEPAQAFESCIDLDKLALKNNWSMIRLKADRTGAVMLPVEI